MMRARAWISVGDVVTNTFQATNEVAERYRKHTWTYGQLTVFEGTKTLTVEYVYDDGAILGHNGFSVFMPIHIVLEMRKAYLEQQEKQS